MSWLSQPGDFVVDVSAGTNSTAMNCFTVLRHQEFAGCTANQKYFGVEKEAVVRDFAKAAFDARTDAEMNGQAGESVLKVAYVMRKVATTDKL